MKSFLKSLLASLLGCFVAIGIAFFVIVVTLIGMTIPADSGYTARKHTVFKLSLEGNLTDRTNVDPINKLLTGDKTKELSLVSVLKAIKIAKSNKNIEGMYLEAGMLNASSASIKEIRDALLDFKTSGKFIVSYGDFYLQNAYYLSSVSDKILVNPSGKIDISGMSSTPMFFKNLAAKLGVKMQVFKVGTFKSAVEPFILDKMSDANRAQVTSYLTDAWETLSTEVSASRNMDVSRLNALVDSFPALRKAESYITSGLADSLLYRSGVENYLKELTYVKEGKKLRLASIGNVLSLAGDSDDDDDNVIGILFAEGEIKSGDSKQEINDKHFVRELKKLKENDKIKAVVFRISSPGGSAFASEQIWKAVAELKEKKPVVVSMGTYAASGGYYIACNASTIFAQPNTLTGSIGIFGMIPSFEGMTKNIGLDFDNVKTNQFSDFGSVYRDMNADEKALLQDEIERGYDLFLTRCADGRNISKDSLNLIAQGRVWTGRQALENGLVDKLGGLNDAINEAASLAELSNYSLRNYPAVTDSFKEMLSTYREKVAMNAMEDYFGTDFEYLKILKEIKNLKDKDYIQARLPYDYPLQ